MNYSLLDKGNKSITNLSKDVSRSFFWDMRVLVDILFQVAITYLLDDVVVMRAFHDVEHADDVLGFEQLQDLYFGEECVFEVLILIN